MANLADGRWNCSISSPCQRWIEAKDMNTRINKNSIRLCGLYASMTAILRISPIIANYFVTNEW